MPVVEASEGIVVVHDADVWTEGLKDAIQAVREGASWAVPHRIVQRLSEEGTGAFMAGETFGPFAQPPYHGALGGGIVVARRETLLEVPLDPRFVGWGQEDRSWGLALHTLVGPPWRGDAPLYHLWHPPQERLSRKYGSLEGRRLFRRYIEARRQGPDAMRELLKEIDVSHLTDQQAMHDRQAQPIG